MSKTPRRRSDRGLSSRRGNDRSALGLRLESLEPRALLSANTATAADIVISPGVSASDIVATPDVTNNSVSGMTPAQIAQIYGINQISFTSATGGKIVGDGAGQTIAIVDAYDDPNIAADLAAFDKQFNLPAASFSKVEQYINGQAPQVNAGWSLEISLDVEWAHAMAPGAKILLVEANSASLNNLLASENYARNATGVSVVSMSWGAGEFNGETSYDSYFTTPAGHAGVSFVASAGDSGAGALWPAISSNVLSVGGTALTLQNGTYVETAWSGSGGGLSQLVSEPSYQRGVQSTGLRSSPDVAYDASPSSGFAVYDSVSYSGQSGWFRVGGTSAGAPQWGAIIAIANQGRALAGLGSLSHVQSALYSLPASDFHDITSGSNGHAATIGYDLVTGRGSPIATLIVSGLIGNSSVSPAVTTTTASSASALTSSSARSKFELSGSDTLDGISDARLAVDASFGQIAFALSLHSTASSAMPSMPNGSLAGPVASASIAGSSTSVTLVAMAIEPATSLSAATAGEIGDDLATSLSRGKIFADTHGLLETPLVAPGVPTMGVVLYPVGYSRVENVAAPGSEKSLRQSQSASDLCFAEGSWLTAASHAAAQPSGPSAEEHRTIDGGTLLTLAGAVGLAGAWQWLADQRGAGAWAALDFQPSLSSQMPSWPKHSSTSTRKRWAR